MVKKRKILRVINQNIPDFLLQHYGNTDAIFSFLNEQNIQYDEFEDSKFFTMDEVENNNTNYYKQRNFDVATGIDKVNYMPLTGASSLSLLSVSVEDGYAYKSGVTDGISLVSTNVKNTGETSGWITSTVYTLSGSSSAETISNIIYEIPSLQTVTNYYDFINPENIIGNYSMNVSVYSGTTLIGSEDIIYQIDQINRPYFTGITASNPITYSDTLTATTSIYNPNDYTLSDVKVVDTLNTDWVIYNESWGTNNLNDSIYEVVAFDTFFFTNGAGYFTGVTTAGPGAEEVRSTAFTTTNSIGKVYQINISYTGSVDTMVFKLVNSSNATASNITGFYSGSPSSQQLQFTLTATTSDTDVGLYCQFSNTATTYSAAMDINVYEVEITPSGGTQTLINTNTLDLISGLTLLDTSYTGLTAALAEGELTIDGYFGSNFTYPSDTTGYTGIVINP